MDFWLAVVAHLEVLEDVPSLRAVEGEHEAPGHEGGFDISELQLVQGQHKLLVFLLKILRIRSWNMILKILPLRL